MIRVKEFLDENFYKDDGCLDSTATIKANGQYSVHGHWHYPKKIDWQKSFISCSCNNETLYRIICVIDGKSVGYYSYLQTYLHILRGDPDEHGYYRRSTDDEIIKYINEFFLKICTKEIRDKKLKKLLNEEN